MFTRQHYIAIAKILKDVRMLNAADQREQIGDELADYFQRDNERFDRERFMEAAELGE